MREQDYVLVTETKNGNMDSLLKLHTMYRGAVKTFGRKYFQKFFIPTLEECDIDCIVDYHLLDAIKNVDTHTNYSLYTLLVNQIKYVLNNIFRYYFAAKRAAGNFVRSHEELGIEPKNFDLKSRDFIVADYLDSVNFTKFEKKIAMASIMDGYGPSDIATLFNIRRKSVSNALIRIKIKLANNWKEKQDY